MLVCMRRCVRYDVMNRFCDIVGLFSSRELAWTAAVCTADDMPC